MVCGYDTDTELAEIDDDDDSPTDGGTMLPTFSMAQTLHESADVVRVASFPPPPVVEASEPTAVDWDAATPPIAYWPSGIRDLFDGNPTGAQTWDEVTAALQKLVIYHAVRRTSPVVSHDARTTMSARSIAHAARCVAAACFARRKAKPAQTETTRHPFEGPKPPFPLRGTVTLSPLPSRSFPFEGFASHPPFEER